MKFRKYILLLFSFLFATTCYCQSSNSCTPEGGKELPGGEDHGSATDSTQGVGPADPNLILSPIGFDSARWVSVNDNMAFTIYFENDPELASAPAHNVYIYYRFNVHQDPTTFKLGNYGFNGMIFTVPPNLNYYQTRLDLRDSLGLYVDVIAGIDVVTRSAFWIFKSIDPLTNQPPLDPLSGFLPVKDTSLAPGADTVSAKGEGFVAFTTKPLSSSHTRDTIFATAQIVFDVNDTIPTNTEFNTIDAVGPTSIMDVSPIVAGDTIKLSWTAEDDLNGSGVKSFELYVSENDGPFSLYRSGLVNTFFDFVGTTGNKYCFFTLASDHVNNREGTKNGCEATVQLTNCATPFSTDLITGPSNACPYSAATGPYANNNATYTIQATGATYEWSIPAGVTNISGLNSPSLEVHFASNFVSGNISVKTKSICNAADSIIRTFPVTKAIPAAPDTVMGPLNACAYIGTGTQVIYSVNPVPGAIAYRWTLPSTVSLVGTNLDSSSITVTINTGFNSGSYNIIKVRSISGCGSSADKILSIPTLKPGVPKIIEGPTNACLFIGTVNEATYKTNRVANASSYAWTLPTGVSIVAHPNGPGIMDTVIRVTFDNNFVSPSNISVQAISLCGVSAVKTLAISRINTTTPGSITGPTDPCPTIGTTQGAVYSIAALPNASSYNWIVPAGDTIISGQGTTTITVHFNPLFTTGSIQVQSLNGCLQSAFRTLVLARKLPATPGAIDAILVDDCPLTRQYSYSIPSPLLYSNSIFWQVPSGGNIVNNGQGTANIVVEYGPGAIDDTLSVNGVNNCGNGQPRKKRIRLTACPPVTTFTKGLDGNGINETKPVIPATGDLSTMNVQLFPNPSRNDFNLKISTINKEEIIVRVLDMSGRECNHIKMIPGQTISFGSKLKTGVYMVEISQGKNTIARKVVKF